MMHDKALQVCPRSANAKIIIAVYVDDILDLNSDDTDFTAVKDQLLKDLRCPIMERTAQYSQFDPYLSRLPLTSVMLTGVVESD